MSGGCGSDSRDVVERCSPVYFIDYRRFYPASASSAVRFVACGYKLGRDTSARIVIQRGGNGIFSGFSSINLRHPDLLSARDPCLISTPLNFFLSFVSALIPAHRICGEMFLLFFGLEADGCGRRRRLGCFGRNTELTRPGPPRAEPRAIFDPCRSRNSSRVRKPKCHPPTRADYRNG